MTPELPGAAPTGRRMRMRVRQPRRVPFAEAPTPPGTSVQHAAAAVGAVLVLVGLLGFLPGPTVHFTDLRVVPYSSAALLGLFSVSVLHNVIHVLVGVTGIVLARHSLAARGFLVTGGLLSLLLVLLVLWRGQPADIWLRLILGAGMIALAFLPGRKRESG